MKSKLIILAANDLIRAIHTCESVLVQSRFHTSFMGIKYAFIWIGSIILLLMCTPENFTIKFCIENIVFNLLHRHIIKNDNGKYYI